MSTTPLTLRRSLAFAGLLAALTLGLTPAARAGVRFQPVATPAGAETLALAPDGATLWAGTLRGVWKLSSGAWSFDGLSDRTVLSLAVADGALWAATGEGLWKRAADGKWGREALPGAPSIINAVLADGGALYAAGLGVFRRSGGAWVSLAPPGGVVISLTGFSGDLVAGLAGNGAVRFSGGAVTPLFAGLGPGEGAQTLTVNNTILWAGTFRGAYWWNGVSWTLDSSFGVHDVRALASALGTLWAATADAGIFQKNVSSWGPVNRGLSVASAKSLALLGNDLYAGTAGGPVYRFLGSAWVQAAAGLTATTISDAMTRDLSTGTATIATRGAGLIETLLPPPNDNILPDGCGDVSAVVQVGGPTFVQYLAATSCGPLLGTDGFFNSATVGLPQGVAPETLASTPSGDAFGGTTNAGVWRFDGTSWSADNSGLSPSASVGAIRQVGADLFAAAGLGVVRRGTDGQWREEVTGLPFAATVLSFGGPGSPAGPVFAGLQTGGVYRRNPSSTVWRRDAVGATNSAIYSIDLSNSRVFAAAGPAGFLRKLAGAWLPENSGLPAGVNAVVVRNARTSGGAGTDYLFAGTAGHGLFTARSNPSVTTVPVVLDVTGGTGTRFRTELTLGNRGAQPVAALVSFAAAPDFGAPAGGSATVTLSPGTEIRAGDALAYLRALGIPIPAATATAPVAGSLMVGGGSVADGLYAAARSYAGDAAGGTYGVFLDATSDLDAAEDEAYVYGLRTSSGVSRSNLAVTHVPGRSADPIVLEVQLFDATGAPAPTVLTRTLTPGEWFQWNGVLEKAGLPDASFGYARIRRVSGIGAWIVYGIVNDAVTSDGSVFPMFRPGGLSAARKLIVPVVLDTWGEAGSHFTTELTLANDGPIGTPVDLVYRPAPGFGMATGAPVVTVNLAARAQTTIRDVIQFLRDHGVGIPDPRTAGPQAGTLSVEFRSLASFDAPRTVALARTSTPGAVGGTYGVSYPAFATGGGARSSAVVPGLLQSAAARSNLAVVHAGGGSGGPLALSVQLHDASTGAPVGIPLSVTLNAGDWFQWSRVLDKAGAVTAGTTQAYAVVTRVSGDDTFFCYGVVNDAVTSDGSLIRMLPDVEY